ncbi:MAG: DUF4197 domain-containing protein [Acidobacteriaceae bacterium]
MALLPVGFVVSLGLLLSGSGLVAQIPQIPTFGQSRGLSESTMASGVKEALAVGTQNAVKQVARPGGYLENQEIKILLPASMRPVEQALRTVGQGPRIDDFVASMNHAAESAAPEAGKIFADAVRGMTVEDARTLLSGGDTSITDYFKSKTSMDLAVAFRPHVDPTMRANGVTQQYEALAGQMPNLPFMKTQSVDITGYVVQKALDGLFVMLGKQEKAIRTNPAARSTTLLRQVFGR